jgi:hypothetical protein
VAAPGGSAIDDVVTSSWLALELDEPPPNRLVMLSKNPPTPPPELEPELVCTGAGTEGAGGAE